MRNILSPKVLAAVVIGSVALAAAFFSRDYWLPWLGGAATDSTAEQHKPSLEETTVLKLSPQARKNLGLVALPLELETYTRSIQIPGVIVDRPGVSDRGVTAPAVGIVARIHAFPGDTVRPGEKLFTLRSSASTFRTRNPSFSRQRENMRLSRTSMTGSRPWPKAARCHKPS